MKIKILGSSAGGGFPQWNCNCTNCKGFRRGTIRASMRTQSSIIVSENRKDWTLVNASPDILFQAMNTPELHPIKTKRNSRIKNILLMDAQVDHITGLLMLREGCPHKVYCTKEVHHELNKGFPMFKILSHWKEGLYYNEIRPGEDFKIPPHKAITFEGISLISNAPPYSKYRDKPRKGDNIGLVIKNKKNKRSIFYAPGLGKITKKILSVFDSSDVLLIDGTCWADSEMKQFGKHERTSREMGHLPISGKGGLIEVLKDFPKKRKILIHINNTNPILDEDSKERSILTSYNIEVAFDGMSITL